MNNRKVARRTFLRTSLVAATALPLGAIPLTLKAGEHVDEADPAASALGYRHDTAAVDGAKFPQHAPDQVCDNCQLFQGADAEGWGGCAIFPGKQVNAKGWCSAWVKKAG